MATHSSNHRIALCLSAAVLAATTLYAAGQSGSAGGSSSGAQSGQSAQQSSPAATANQQNQAQRTNPGAQIPAQAGAINQPNAVNAGANVGPNQVGVQNPTGSVARPNLQGGTNTVFVPTGGVPVYNNTGTTVGTSGNTAPSSGSSQTGSGPGDQSGVAPPNGQPIPKGNITTPAVTSLDLPGNHTGSGQANNLHIAMENLTTARTALQNTTEVDATRRDSALKSVDQAIADVQAAMNQSNAAIRNTPTPAGSGNSVNTTPTQANNR